MKQFTNPLSLQTVAYTKDGSYLFHLAEFRELDKSVVKAAEFANRPNYARKGYYAVVRDSSGNVLHDTRKQ